ncbi:MAG: hypothetical protein QXX95_05005 [Nitrososphaerales archaeon]
MVSSLSQRDPKTGLPTKIKIAQNEAIDGQLVEGTADPLILVWLIYKGWWYGRYLWWKWYWYWDWWW